MNMLRRGVKRREDGEERKREEGRREAAAEEEDAAATAAAGRPVSIENDRVVAAAGRAAIAADVRIDAAIALILCLAAAMAASGLVVAGEKRAGSVWSLQPGESVDREARAGRDRGSRSMRAGSEQRATSNTIGARRPAECSGCGQRGRARPCTQQCLERPSFVAGGAVDQGEQHRIIGGHLSPARHDAPKFGKACSLSTVPNFNPLPDLTFVVPTTRSNAAAASCSQTSPILRTTTRL